MFFNKGSELRKIYKKAKKQDYGFIASNIAESNIMMGLLAGADEKNSDLVLQLSKSACEFAGAGDPLKGLEGLGGHTRKISEKYNIGVFLNMDHLKDLNFIEAAIKTGFPASVMIDASKEPFEENIEISKKVKNMAKENNVLVEAELGKIKGVEDKVSSKEAFYTDPAEAVEFVEKTNCDLLAISIGTEHGVSKGKDLELRIDLAQKIDNELREHNINIPLVLHGSSGILPGQMEKLTGKGICKFNKDTRYQYEYAQTASKFYKKHEKSILPPENIDPTGFFSESDWSPNKSYFDPRVVSRRIREEIKKTHQELIEQVGSSNKSLYK